MSIIPTKTLLATDSSQNAKMARAAGQTGHSLVQQHPPCREGGDAHISVVRAERRASDQRGHR
jgi:pyruvate/2-oxoacid:ferredoxin oxidoreductase beta subunit